MKTRSNYHGFTLVELMISLGLIAIVLSVAVPSVSNMIKDNRLATQVNSVISDIHYARSEATKRDARVIMCRTLIPNNTPTFCAGLVKNWATGYLVFVSGDNNNTYQASTDTLLRRGQPSQEGTRLRTNETWNNNLEINPTGTLNESGTAIMAFCDDRGNSYGRQITIPMSGSPRMSSNNIASCTP